MHYLSSAAHSVRLCHLSKYCIKLNSIKIDNHMNEIQRAELKEYLETILDLYGEDEYEEFVEDIVYHYCERKFGVGREESVKTFYELIKELQ